MSAPAPCPHVNNADENAPSSSAKFVHQICLIAPTTDCLQIVSILAVYILYQSSSDCQTLPVLILSALLKTSE